MHRSRDPRSSPPISVVLSVVLLSGAAALVYEVLWLKELSRLFGATAHAAATTLAVFFLGLATGSSFWGRRASSRSDPVRTYVLLEIGIAASALAYFIMLSLYRASYQVLFGLVGEQQSGVFTVVKVVLAAGILFPPAFFMGGTIPVVTEIVVRTRKELSTQVTRLYACNTAGAAVGSVLAGFYLPVALGFRNSYFVAIGANLSIAAIMWRWRGASDHRPFTSGDRTPQSDGHGSPTSVLAPGVFWTIAGCSGLLTLALEVLWTRMYAQVL